MLENPALILFNAGLEKFSLFSVISSNNPNKLWVFLKFRIFLYSKITLLVPQIAAKNESANCGGAKLRHSNLKRSALCHEFYENSNSKNYHQIV